MTAFEYVMNSLAWSLLGFIAGWLLASLRHDVHALKEAVVPNTPVAHVGRRTITTAQATRMLGVVVLLLAVVTVGQGVVQAHRVQDVTECQAEFNAEFARVSTLRADLANQDRVALQNMLLALYRQRGADEARRLETFEKWVNTVRRSDAERRSNPLPEYPEGDCR